ncbi:hypothetical protein D6D54_05085 [Spiroplasma poulsonii]|uniref:Uncharacterized protein n=2 Tax=Spiroplasma poulsonii TaxID=2138 RepID=A0A3S0UB69_9MOLU|nr:hypothetical protein [Spiroplasma poulsonii]RUP76811.1 hypothetical protein D6D54_05085 [Spiroplasma poulsonii]
MLTNGNLDAKTLKTFNFLNSLKLNFLSIERILKMKTELTFDQKTVIIGLLRKQHNMKTNLYRHYQPVKQHKPRRIAKPKGQQVTKKVAKTTGKQTETAKNKRQIHITNIRKTHLFPRQNNLLELTKQKINALRNAVHTYNRMRQGAIKWQNPYYTSFRLKQENNTKRHKNL